MWDRFSRRVLARLQVGQEQYGDLSPDLPNDRLVDEIQQELEDVAGWGLILWWRLQRCKASASKVDLNENEEVAMLKKVAESARACLTVVASDETDEALLDNLSSKLLDLEMVRAGNAPKSKKGKKK